jgi:ABC-2 type transport system ATP-binding protein
MKEPSSRTILQVNSICKSFLNVQAVKDIGFSIEQGDVFALLGPNGAGKTTILRILLDIIRADSGSIQWQINGNKCALPSAEHIGYLPEERGLYLDIPVLSSLVYLATIRGMDKSKAKLKALDWLKRLELADRANEKLHVLSKGNQQKIQFIASILHQPSFAILDEPFSGLDPLNQEKFIAYIKEINEQGTTILISAHQMNLVEKIANKVLLINKGQQLYYGNLTRIYDLFAEQHIINIRLDTPASTNKIQLFKGVESLNYLDDVNVQLILRLGFNLNSALYELAKMEGIKSVTSYKPDLHDIFLQLVNKHNQ